MNRLALTLCLAAFVGFTWMANARPPLPASKATTTSKPANAQAATQPNATQPNATQPNPKAGAVKFNGHFYKVFKAKVTWHEAKKRCEAMGGYLVCIETKEEQAFITKLAANDYYFLGGTDEKKEGAWTWVNGSKWEYTNWMDGQPNNFDGIEHYLSTYDDGEWNDAEVGGDDFWSPTGFICEWEK